MMRFALNLRRDQAGVTALEFALVAPTFLMFIFLILDGGRMMFAKQSLNEVATATARCTALKANGCDTVTNAQSWAISRGLARDNLNLVAANVTILYNTTCNNVGNMAKATVSMPWKKGAMTFLPQSVAPSSLSSIACFPVAS